MGDEGKEISVSPIEAILYDHFLAKQLSIMLEGYLVG
jgi:hypothetical protein